MGTCIVHGDFHPSNLFFRNTDGEAVLIDWQCWGAGHPVTEIVYFFFAGLHNDGTKFCKEHVLALLKEYHSEFVRCRTSTGESECYSWQQLILDFASFAIDFLF